MKLGDICLIIDMPRLQLMNKSKEFLAELVKSYKLERILSVEIIHGGLDSHQSIHHKILYLDNSGVSENLSVSIQDVEGFFGVILHEHGEELKLVYKNKNKKHEKWDDINEDTSRFVISVDSYRTFDYEEDEEIYDVFEIKCDACVIRVYVKINSEDSYRTAFARFRGKFHDLHKRMEYYPIEAVFLDKSSGESKVMLGMRDNGFMGRGDVTVFYTNQNDDFDESEEYLEPERQYVHIRTGSSDSRKDISFDMTISVIPEYHAPNDQSVVRFKFVVADFVEGFDENGCWAIFEDENYSLTFTIRFDTPSQYRIEDIAERFKK